jgi:hypothetical protein
MTENDEFQQTQYHRREESLNLGHMISFEEILTSLTSAPFQLKIEKTDQTASRAA